MTPQRFYVLPYTIVYHSPRYDKWVTVLEGTKSDGATGALDLWSEAWWIHDELCKDGTWDDGTPCSNYQASAVLSDVLKAEGRWARAFYWRWATYLWRRIGGHE